MSMIFASRRTLPLRIGLLLLGICLTVSCPGWALDPGLPPGKNIDLSHWMLAIPVDAYGGTNGPAVVITPAQLAAGYSDPLYFYTGADGATRFWCPVTGAFTVALTYPRTELRESLDGATTNENWTGTGTHLLEAQCQVNQLPSSGKVVIGQIHGFNVN